MTQLENEIEDIKFFESILAQPTNVKHIAIENGTKRSYNRKSKVNEKAKAQVEKIMNNDNIKDNVKDIEVISRIVNEAIYVPPVNEPIIKQTIKEKYEKILHDLCNAEGHQEIRFAKQYEAYTLKKQQDLKYEQESKLED
ncbi:MAG: hypothetical protein EZS28_019496 [Streblomastix strix]|uniref:Uncharacterized protein n=1 Tax=Streblomastix strix TaxID=222440 RepID=A0A5J4VS01_9EUKA|nr:MAG: hypothetical protein EZS28_019496 [Streblomastix strix]